MIAKKKPAHDAPARVVAEAPVGARRRGEPKPKKPRPISENPGAALSLVLRARRGR